MNDQKLTPEQNIYLPPRANKAAIEEFEKRAKSDIRIDFGHPEVDDTYVPAVAGDLISIIGRPGHGKTTLLLHFARRAEELFRQTEEYVLYATWEVLVEEFVALSQSHQSGQSLESIARGTADLTRIRDTMATQMGSKIIVFGRSMEQTRYNRMPSMDDLNEALLWLQSRYPIGLIVVDYLQRLPAPSQADRSKVVTENLERLKDTAIVHRAPVMVGVQARRDVDTYAGIRMPQLSDAQWSSSVEQTSDKVWAITKPSNHLELGTDIELPTGGLVEVTSDLFVTKMLKQRWSSTGRFMFLRANYGTMQFSPATIQTPAF